jgi:hypothetical protein
LYFTAAPLHGADGRVIGAVETLQDISEQKRYEAQLESQARQDLLTGLANRRVLEERLKLALSQAARDERVVAVAFIDLDRFKPINDELGMRQETPCCAKSPPVSRRPCARSIPSRGSAVTSLWSCCPRPSLWKPSRAWFVASSPRSAARVEVAGHVRAGGLQRRDCAVSGARPGSGQRLLSHADTAMYVAKASGRNTYHIHAS